MRSRMLTSSHFLRTLIIRSSKSSLEQSSKVDIVLSLSNKIQEQNRHRQSAHNSTKSEITGDVQYDLKNIAPLCELLCPFMCIIFHNGRSCVCLHRSMKTIGMTHYSMCKKATIDCRKAIVAKTCRIYGQKTNRSRKSQTTTVRFVAWLDKTIKDYS
jgi:hypothetical protein